MSFFLALLPILVILILMLGLRWKTSWAGLAGYGVALLIAAVGFGAQMDLLLVAHGKALLLALDVLLIVWMAFLHFRVADEAGAIDDIGAALPGLTADRGMLALILGFAFASFLQGVGGFGVPVAVIAPLLIGLGFSPLTSLVIPSVGHAWSITFGSLGSSFQALVAASGLRPEVLAGPAALVLGILAIVSGWLVVHAADGRAGLRRLWLPALLLGAVMGAAQWLAAKAGLYNLAATLAGIVGLIVAIGLSRFFQGQAASGAALQFSGLLLAGSAYLVLVVLTLSIQLVPALHSALNIAQLNIRFPAVATRLGFATAAEAGRQIPWLVHGGSVLLYASLIGYAVYRFWGRYESGAVRRIWASTLSGIQGSTISILALVAMAVVMTHAGMTDALAQGLADAVGSAFLVVSPWIGGLGAFMTGSNTNSNVIFTELQVQTGALLGYAAAWVLAAQTAGGAVGSIIAPTKIVVGAATAGMAGREGDVIRRLAGYLLVLMIAATVVVLLLNR